jgi:hypothetical protein
VAIVGIDIDASDIIYVKNQLFRNTALIVLFNIILSVILSMFLSRSNGGK